MSWLRRSFLTGLVVTVPLAITVVTLVWFFRFIDGFARPLSIYLLGREVPGLGVLLTAAVILVTGAVATNVIGRRILQRAEAWLLNVPLFKTVYAPVKQLVAAFSPDSETGFKKVVVVDDAERGMVIGFLTREFTMDRGSGPEAMVAVYVPTNHLYLGDVFVYPRNRVSYPDLSVEEGIRIFLTGGMALPNAVSSQQSAVKSAVNSRQSRV
jgi:uncharacterized membrane protein